VEQAAPDDNWLIRRDRPQDRRQICRSARPQAVGGVIVAIEASG
jgi:hypothetical protein